MPESLTSQETQVTSTSSRHLGKWRASYVAETLSELRAQRGLALPLAAMNLAWFLKVVITTTFLGRLGDLSLAGGALGFTFANVTGFSVLSGLCGAMEPICGQAFGANNFRLLHKTLIMTTLMLLLVTVPITFLWLHVDEILVRFGQREDIAAVAKTYLFYLVPNLAVTAFLCPLKTYLSTQGVTVPIMLSSALALALHVPINVLLSRAKGLEGVAISVWISDLISVFVLIVYVFLRENQKEGTWTEGGWSDIGLLKEWVRLVKLAGPCCLTVCLEWWCYECLVLLTGRLDNAKREVGVISVVMSFDYLLYSVMYSLATSASIRVSNELGGNQAHRARRAAYVALGASVATGFLAGASMVAVRGIWGRLFSHDKMTIKRVEKTMLLMAVLEVVIFPMVVSGGIIRGVARPMMAVLANIGGFYLVSLPVGVALAFRVGLGLSGLLMGFLVGIIVCLALFLVFIFRIEWAGEARKAQELASASDNGRLLV